MKTIFEQKKHLLLKPLLLKMFETLIWAPLLYSSTRLSMPEERAGRRIDRPRCRHSDAARPLVWVLGRVRAHGLPIAWIHRLAGLPGAAMEGTSILAIRSPELSAQTRKLNH